MINKICVIGLGYIGLPTAVMFANYGKQVHGVDTNEEIVNKINQKQLHIEEKGLKEKLIKAIDQRQLTVSSQPEHADVFIIAVPSPIKGDKTANLSYVEKATESIAPYLQKGNLVILESTVPPLTVEKVMLPILKQTNLEIGTELFVAHSPERVIPGKVFEELINNDRIIGGINDKSSELAVELYRTFVVGDIHITDAKTAELVKVIENTYRDVNIAFANELARICDNLNINVWEAIKLANHHPRVNIHSPGPGVGGHCIAVDPWFLVELQPETARMIGLARNINDSMPLYTTNRVTSILNQKSIHHGKVALLGLSYKADIDDTRESPSLDVIRALEEQKVEYSVFDPHIKEQIFIKQAATIEEAVEHADLILIMTNHLEFKKLNPESLKDKMRTKIIYDTKKCIDEDKWNQAGFEVHVLGDSSSN
ncbi:UDP-N-acetyl-D-mannosaminuronic acid dehydrogenase [Bacillus niacini]|uniref:UDP-N-acetyl-D-mannosaminuronic acid dehydrogenase n=1 Tax=Neobacillus niacini TaxID=86668 RepID=A0A852T5Z1_9BACI|nr:nucleotide sugar dehydrogenase [Neobacillus niacini]NYE03621.1 UDP-N-acetyl-D-mannosaminuronic acid dehydrogenase [Neobacillus niacini]